MQQRRSPSPSDDHRLSTVIESTYDYNGEGTKRVGGYGQISAAYDSSVGQVGYRGEGRGGGGFGGGAAGGEYEQDGGHYEHYDEEYDDGHHDYHDYHDYHEHEHERRQPHREYDDRGPRGGGSRGGGEAGGIEGGGGGEGEEELLDQLYISSLTLEEIYATLRTEVSPPWRRGHRGPHLENLRRLLGSGCDPNSPLAAVSGVDRQMPLHCVAAAGHAEAVQVLVNHGAAIHSETAAGNTALHLAAMQGSTEVVAMLLRCKGDPAVRSAGSEWTPLHCAALHGHLPIIELLLAAGVDVSAKSELGQSGLHLACAVGGRAAVERLLAAGAHKDDLDNRGMTPYDCAKRAGHSELALDIQQWTPEDFPVSSSSSSGGGGDGRAGSSSSANHGLLDFRLTTNSPTPGGGRLSPEPGGGGWTPTAREATLEAGLVAAEQLLANPKDIGAAWQAAVHLLRESTQKRGSCSASLVARIHTLLVSAGEQGMIALTQQRSVGKWHHTAEEALHEKQVEELTAQVESARETIKLRDSELAALRAQLQLKDEDGHKVANMVEEINALTVELSSSNSNFALLQASSAELKASATAEQAAAQDTIAHLKAQATELQGKLDACQAHLAEEQEALQKASAEAGRQTAKANALAAAVSSAKPRLDLLAQAYWSGLSGGKLKAALQQAAVPVEGNKAEQQAKGIAFDKGLLAGA